MDMIFIACLLCLLYYRPFLSQLELAFSVLMAFAHLLVMVLVTVNVVSPDVTWVLDGSAAVLLGASIAAAAKAVFDLLRLLRECWGGRKKQFLPALDSLDATTLLVEEMTCLHQDPRAPVADEPLPVVSDVVTVSPGSNENYVPPSMLWKPVSTISAWPPVISVPPSLSMARREQADAEQAAPPVDQTCSHFGEFQSSQPTTTTNDRESRKNKKRISL